MEGKDEKGEKRMKEESNEGGKKWMKHKENYH